MSSQTHFRPASVTGPDGALYAFGADDLAALTQPGLGWHAAGDPSSWLCSAAVSHARHKFGAHLGRADIVALTAATLGISPSALEQALDWNANYLAWHDGGSPDQNHVYPASEP